MKRIKSVWILLPGYLVAGTEGVLLSLQNGLDIRPVIAAGVCGILLTLLMLLIIVHKGVTNRNSIFFMVDRRAHV